MCTANFQLSLQQVHVDVGIQTHMFQTQILIFELIICLPFSS